MEAQEYAADCSRHMLGQVFHRGLPETILTRDQVNQFQYAGGIAACQDIRSTLDCFRPLCDIPQGDAGHSRNASLLLDSTAIGQKTERGLLQLDEIKESERFNKM